MENDLKGNENYFESTEVRVMEGSSYRESTVLLYWGIYKLGGGTF